MLTSLPFSHKKRVFHSFGRFCTNLSEGFGRAILQASARHLLWKLSYWVQQMHCQAQASHHVVTRFNIILSTTTITTAIWITTANTNPSIQSVSGIAYNFNFQANITITKTQCIVYLETKARASIHQENSIQNHLWNGLKNEYLFKCSGGYIFILKDVDHQTILSTKV